MTPSFEVEAGGGGGGGVAGRHHHIFCGLVGPDPAEYSSFDHFPDRLTILPL